MYAGESAFHECTNCNVDADVADDKDVDYHAVYLHSIMVTAVTVMVTVKSQSRSGCQGQGIIAQHPCTQTVTVRP